MFGGVCENQKIEPIFDSCVLCTLFEHAIYYRVRWQQHTDVAKRQIGCDRREYWRRAAQ